MTYELVKIILFLLTVASIAVWLSLSCSAAESGASFSVGLEIRAGIWTRWEGGNLMVYSNAPRPVQVFANGNPVAYDTPFGQPVAIPLEGLRNYTILEGI